MAFKFGMENHQQEDKENKNQKEPKQEAAAEKEKIISLPESEYLKLKEDADKVKEFWDRIVRLQADFENIRKRQEREKQDFFKYASEGIISELLVVLDDLERAVELASTKHQDLSAFLKGVEMILAHLYEMLKDHGVRPIEAEGKKFDPNYHEAMMQIDNNDLPEHTVVQELQKGYMLNDRILRTAKVKVSKKQEQKGKEEK